ncbi:MAG: sodium-dependent transporter [Gemmatimonadota bacterium]
MASREHWGSRLGFIMAAAGSAVGLGNLWKFPYITYENRGGSFVLVYLACVALVGLPIMIAEFVMGRRSERNLVGAFEVLRPGAPLWKVVGWMGVLNGFVILSYYSVVAGWTLEYTLRSAVGFFEGMTGEEISGSFVTFLANPYKQVWWHGVFMALTLGVVIGGIHRGIERWTKILMPILAVLVVLLMGYSMAVGDSRRALAFLFNFSSPITAHGVLEALGHAFFTLSVGMGVMVTYGSYLSRDQDIGKVAFTVTLMDTVIALAACLMLYPIIFAYDVPIAESIGIIFTTLPFVFQQMPFGSVMAPLFFLLVAFAALSSTISLLEVVVTYAVDEWGRRRQQAAVVAAAVIFLFGVPSALCLGAWPWLSRLTLLSKGGTALGWFDSFDYLATNWLLPLGGLAIAVFAGWSMTEADRESEFETGEDTRRVLDYRLWRFVIRYVSPVAVFVVLLYKVGVVGKG